MAGTSYKEKNWPEISGWEGEGVTSKSWRSLQAKGMPRIAGNHQKLRRGKDRFIPRGFQENVALPKA